MRVKKKKIKPKIVKIKFINFFFFKPKNVIKRDMRIACLNSLIFDIILEVIKKNSLIIMCVNTVWDHYDWRRCMHFKPPVEKRSSREKITNRCLFLGKQRTRTYKYLFLIQFSGISCSVYAGFDRTRARVELTIIIVHIPVFIFHCFFSSRWFLGLKLSDVTRYAFT